MKRAGSNGLMAFWADFAPEDVDAFREWHNCEHMTERCSIPGFNVGRRYCGIGDAPTVLMYYETDEANVLASNAYHARLNAPTSWTKATLPLFKNADRNIFTIIGEAGAPAVTEAPYTTTLRFNLTLENETEAGAWHRNDWLKRLAARQDVIRARLYEVDEEISGIMTAERKIYGGGPGALKYLAVVETEGRDCPGLENTGPHKRQDEKRYSFWLDMALYAPSAYSGR
ncbi:hypothetical protein N9F34_05115 [Alphaproteobacteria bacterium]|nr:hypothetical protein [Alphaproteobacteria bacterium]